MILSVAKRFVYITLMIFPVFLIPENLSGQCVPVAKCKSYVNFSLDNNGIALVPAFLLDNGSQDTCSTPPGTIWFKVKRMNLPVGYDCYNPGNPNYMFDDNMQLCCEDVGDTVQVILRVYNINPGTGPVDDTVGTGHFNDCMLSVSAIDKLPPVITCPPDTTIECGAMFSDYSLYGEPMVIDNCDSVLIEIKVDTQLNICNVGKIIRKFIATDVGGLKDSCIQTITVVNNHPFDGNDPNQLIWPPDTAIYGCYDNIDTSISGRPIIIEDECDLVGTDYEDQKYYFGKQTACYKIIRIWKVLDWCQYNPKLGCKPSNACWTHEQIIKILDTIPPEITGIKDTTVFNYTEDCASLYIQLDTAISYDCDSSLIQRYKIEIDLYSDGSIDSVKNGNDASGYYPNGVHRITFKAFDKCGNIGDSTIVLTVIDKKAPAVIGKDGIIVALNKMQTGVMAMVVARQLDNGSYDNCTAQNKLRFSFSPDVNDTIRIYNCDSITNTSVLNVELWVTDESGNQDYIKTFVFVQDNTGLCPDNLKNSIFGLVMDRNGNGLGNISVFAKTETYEIKSESDTRGVYELRKMRDAVQLQVFPDRNDDVLSGVNTRDLVVIQKYLLGKMNFKSPWMYLAADADMSNNISTRDILLLKNLILHKTKALPHNKSWRFVLADTRFIDPLNPFANGIKEDYTIHNFDRGMRIDFKGVKIGDVVFDKKNGTRERETFQGFITRDNTTGDYVLKLDTDGDISGMYLELLLPEDIKDIKIEGMNLRGFSTENYYLDKNAHLLRLVWTDAEGVYVFKGQALISMKFYSEGKLYSISGINWKEAKGDVIMGRNDRSYKLNMAFIENGHVQGALKSPLSDVDVYPNPFNVKMEMKYMLLKPGLVTIRITDQMGEPIYVMSEENEVGEHIISIEESVKWPAGIYFCTIRTGGIEKYLKLVKTE